MGEGCIDIPTIREWVESTGFNGFTSESTIEVEDEPMASLYAENSLPRRRANVVKLGSSL